MFLIRSVEGSTSSVRSQEFRTDLDVLLELPLADVAAVAHHDVLEEVEVGVPELGPLEARLVGVLVFWHPQPLAELHDSARKVRDVGRGRPVPEVLHVQARLLGDVLVVGLLVAPGHTVPEDKDVGVGSGGEVDVVCLHRGREVVKLLGKLITDGDCVEDVEVGVGADQRVVNVVVDGREGVEVMGVERRVDDRDP
eukprot:CAMPEP_0179078010 /NCGR_PEP_ID=MMETSP0796-20121207/34905_1 /TAXON_ID=73915 /ORGANISM="Pyrodinium bahamense, Strain pbaha01" /LENGTH=195 /DNA_ID=CAMNT_0020775299 /DNA_START=210 /DNA_END=797 /DNA_ORIENTATION=-